MYVITRRDLSFPQQSVQSSHAAIESARKFLTTPDEHPSVILCAERNESKLISAINRLERNGIKFCIWREPDRDNEITAISTEPISDPLKRKAMSYFQLLKTPELEKSHVA